MREYSVEVSPSALLDIADIYNYIADELVEPETAQFVTNYIWNRIEGLCYFPAAWAKIPVDFEHELRSVSARKYRIIYYIEGDKVIVIRVIHSHRDLGRVISGN